MVYIRLLFLPCTCNHAADLIGLFLCLLTFTQFSRLIARTCDLDRKIVRYQTFKNRKTMNCIGKKSLKQLHVWLKKCFFFNSVELANLPSFLNFSKLNLETLKFSLFLCWFRKKVIDIPLRMWRTTGMEKWAIRQKLFDWNKNILQLDPVSDRTFKKVFDLIFELKAAVKIHKSWCLLLSLKR